MLFIHGFLVIIAIFLYTYIIQIAWRNRKVSGAKTLIALILFAIIWSVGSFLEDATDHEGWMLFWRNIQQIGVFGVPITSFYFAIDYCEKKEYKKGAYVLSVIPILFVILVFTNELHGFVRHYPSTYEIVNGVDKVLIIQSTVLGTIFVSINFAIPVLSLIILIGYYRSVIALFKKQVLWIMISFLWTLIAALIGQVVLPIFSIRVPISILYIPSIFILAFILFRYRLFSISPIAKDIVFDLTEQIVFVLDKEKRIADYNNYAEETISRYIGKKMNFIGLTMKDLVGKEVPNFDSFHERDTWNEDFVFTSNGKKVIFSVNKHPLKPNGEDIIGYVLMANNVTKDRELERKLQFLADHDALTSLYNRRKFRERFEEWEKENANISFLMLDLDHFKPINDNYGHDVGDTVLIHFSNQMKEYFSNHVVARLGGEEFAVAIKDVSIEEVLKLATDFCNIIHNSPAVIEKEQNQLDISYTVSIGISTCFGKECRFTTLMKEADQALYQAKEEGRNRVVRYKE